MKILVAIANYGRKNDAYLHRVLCEYRNMPYETDVVVLSNMEKRLGAEVKVIPGTPTRNPHSLPFGHRRVFAERKDAYDLFLYSEDDILITQRNIEAFLQASAVLPPQELAGFFRWEHYPDGRRYYPDAHFFYRWEPGSVRAIGDHTFARFTNDHSGCFALTRAQLSRAIDSGGFLVPPHQHRMTMLETAATDPYTQCGFRKVLSLSHFDDFLVQHLPNKYLGSPLGLDATEFSKEIRTLLSEGRDASARESLLEPETKVFRCRWSKNFYEPARSDLIDLFPASTRTVLSIGCGWGETEAELERRGIRVMAIPLDRIIGSCAESRGVQVAYGDLPGAIARLRGRRFDGVLMPGILHLLPEPQEALVAAASLLAERGTLVLTIPAFRRLRVLWERLVHPSAYEGLGDFERSGTHLIGRRRAKAWLSRAALSPVRISPTIPRRWRGVVAGSLGLGTALFASEYTLVARHRKATEKQAERLAALKRPGARPEACIADRGASE